MNIYQNGAFSDILHKLTKYQALAASAKDFSKQNLYSQKIQEYRNKLDKMNFAQTGGDLTKEQKKEELVTRISNLVPKSFMDSYNNLNDAHSELLKVLENIHKKVKDIITDYMRSEKTIQESSRELDDKISELSKTNPQLAEANIERKRLQLLLEEHLAKQRKSENAESRANIQNDIDYITKQLAAANMNIIRTAGPELNLIQLLEQYNESSTKVISLTTQLTEAQTTIAKLNSSKSVSGDCNTEIQEILKAINETIATQEKLSPQNSNLDKLQEIVEKMRHQILDTPTSNSQ